MEKSKKTVKTNKKDIQEILQEHNLGIKLDVGCGENKAGADFVGMDVRPLEGVDIVHNIEKFPWPLPDESCSLVVASHVLEHINPASTDPRLVGLINLLLEKGVIKPHEIDKHIGEYEIFGVFIRFMNEVWRVLKPGGRFAFVVPYAGSIGYWQDPTHINPISEATLAYFDPLDQSGLWRIYKPYPWKIIGQPALDTSTFLEVILEKRLIDKAYEPEK